VLDGHAPLAAPSTLHWSPLPATRRLMYHTLSRENLFPPEFRSAGFGLTPSAPTRRVLRDPHSALACQQLLRVSHPHPSWRPELNSRRHAQGGNSDRQSYLASRSELLPAGVNYSHAKFKMPPPTSARPGDPASRNDCARRCLARAPLPRMPTASYYR